MVALTCRPLTKSRWADLERLFGPRGACAGCWCMWFRMARSEFQRKAGEGTKAAFKALTESGVPLGLLAYEGKTAIGWCTVAPRSDYPVLGRSRLFPPVDEKNAWSVTCFYVAKSHRRGGVTAQLLAAAVGYAEKHGAEAVEGYAIESQSNRWSPMVGFVGSAATFRAAGFTEIAHPSPTRRYMRRLLRAT